MDQIKRAHEFQDDQVEQQEAAAPVQELRTLSDLELVLAGGGDGMVTW